MQTFNHQQASALLKATTIINGHYNIESYMARNLIKVQGMIYAPKLFHLNIEELLFEIKLSNKDILRVRNLSNRPEKLSTPLLVLTFGGTTLLEKLLQLCFL